MNFLSQEETNVVMNCFSGENKQLLSAVRRGEVTLSATSTLQLCTGEQRFVPVMSKLANILLIPPALRFYLNLHITYHFVSNTFFKLCCTRRCLSADFIERKLRYVIVHYSGFVLWLLAVPGN